jgi:hypothetical protein
VYVTILPPAIEDLSLLGGAWLLGCAPLALRMSGVTQQVREATGNFD